MRHGRKQRRGGYLIVYGKTTYGAVDQVPGVLQVATEFFHVLPRRAFESPG